MIEYAASPKSAGGWGAGVEGGGGGGGRFPSRPRFSASLSFSLSLSLSLSLPQLGPFDRNALSVNQSTPAELMASILYHFPLPYSVSPVASQLLSYLIDQRLRRRSSVAGGRRGT